MDNKCQSGLWLKRFCLTVVVIMAVSGVSVRAAEDDTGMEADALYQRYRDFFDEVYTTVTENYYRPVETEDYGRFLVMFKKQIYPKARRQREVSDYIKWRSAAYLIEYLKDEQDDFSAFFPPKAAEKFEHQVLGEKIDLGIEGEKTAEGYYITRIEPRSNAYKKGLREEDLILKIDAESIGELSPEDIRQRLMPLKGKIVKLSYRNHQSGRIKSIKVKSEKYFKQTVFLLPTPSPDIQCLEIKSFNRKTGEDMFRFLQYIDEQGSRGLILDLRGNPGGPPLAAREISAFFLEPEEDFAYFQKRNQPKSLLKVPAIPLRYRYTEPVVILVNDQSGSASELFSGIMRFRGRAVLMGQSTAGRVLLKSMYHFDDGSMVALVTARGYYPDGNVFPYEGVAPDVYSDDEGEKLIAFATAYLLNEGGAQSEGN